MTGLELYTAPPAPPPPPLPPAPRRKGAGIRAWLVVSESGQSHLEEVGKHSIMRRTGLPARDLRILDPALSYPSTILGRERAIVVNLEHIKAIITATEVLVLNSQNPAVAPFVGDLESRLANFNAAHLGMDADDSPTISASHNSSQQPYDNAKRTEVIPIDGSDGPLRTEDMPKVDGPKVLPFEFKALEACLESTCRCLESETSTLEQEAYPALDELTSKISTLNLQRVRHIKNRLVALSGRVQKVRDELENLLDDDMDMAEMYLTEKIFRQQSEEIVSKDELDKDIDPLEFDNESYEDSGSNKSSIGNFTGFKPNIEDLEMLLEAYFVQIEGTLNKLSTMRDYVDDTEDYINIMLDDKQNQLLQMGVVLSTATLLFSAGIVVVGLFGMNIKISLFKTEGSTAFWETTIGTLGGCLVLYVIAIHLGKKRGLIG
ncbi:PREDICTED: magnesium transporter MRS2-F-like [Nelumbo nucifera]|uniref:Magnesium transporter n=2 Tax=Nelumbo nucifera TaxID=4432 RepID=A0A1U7Z5P7_NELNU|nr:PREDICTED: magnesium transporter MRS2-F-like [Nelumbo nucifera]DAD39676.1 TPA_asm: hypothetical protein HUJ06_013999 [Nelumbo nucifera]